MKAARIWKAISGSRVDTFWLGVGIVSGFITLIGVLGKLPLKGHPLIPENSRLYVVDTDLTILCALVAVSGFVRLSWSVAAKLGDERTFRSWLNERDFARLLYKFHVFGSQPEDDGSFRYCPARASDLGLFQAWSDEDVTIGALAADRAALYRQWFDADPRCFWLLWRDWPEGGSEPMGCSIILPLTTLGAHVLRKPQNSALKLTKDDIVDARSTAPRDRLLFDTWLRKPGLPRNQEPGFVRMARLLYLHFRGFVEHGTACEIWFEPDHKVLKRLGSLDGLVEDCGEAAVKGSRTYKFDLSSALERLDEDRRRDVYGGA